MQLCTLATTSDSPLLPSPPSRSRSRATEEERKANPAMGQGQSNIEAWQLQWNTRRSRSKFTVREENNRIKYAVSSMQGLRPYMEDAHTAILDLDGSRSTSFFGVYDGHGGGNVAMYCKNQFHTALQSDEGYHNNLDNALRRVFSRMDEQLKEYDEWRKLANPSSKSQGIPLFEGSTACVALIRGHQIIVGNVGDSRCVLSRNGQAIDLSTDHKPNLPEESRRIVNARGRVTKDALYFRCLGEAGIPLGSYRVDGLLPMSRAIGDFYFKSDGKLLATEQLVTCNPDVRTEDITYDTEFLLIASDGIWDVISSQGAVDFVHQKFAGASLFYSFFHVAKGTTDLRTICEALIKRCYSSKGNSTVILVQFRHAGRLPRSAAPAAPVVHPTDAAGSSNPTPSSAGITLDAGGDAKAGINEDGSPQAPST